MTLTHLIERCESGAGPDRDLERDIWIAMGWLYERREKDRKPWLYAPAGFRHDGYRKDPADVISWSLGNMCLTTSLDAVVSLIEQKLPGWCPDVGKVPPFALAPDDHEWSAALMGNEREVTYGHGDPTEMAFDTYNGHASSGARALLAATLRALSVLEDSKASLADASQKDQSHDG